MRVETIRTSNYMTLRAIVIEIPKAARSVLIAGKNGAGKTALIDAIRSTLTGEIPRGLRYKKEVSDLITDGEKDGWVGVTVIDDDGRAVESRLSLKTGATNTPAMVTPPKSLAVTPQHFQTIEPTERRRALFHLYGVSLKQADLVAALEKEGHTSARVAKIATSLGAGFPAAVKRAKELVSEARGGWQALAGETYGSNKAEGWSAPVPEDVPTAGEIEVLRNQLVERRQALVDAVAARKALETDEAAHANVMAATRDAERLPALEAELAALDQQIADARAQQEKLQAAAASAGGWTCDCPSCGVKLRSEKPGKLAVYDAKAATGPRAGAEAEAKSAEIVSLTSTRARKAREVDGARANKLLLERLPARPDAAEITEAKEAARILSEEVAVLEQDLRAADAALEKAASAEGVTARAADFHADVAAFGKLADAIEAIPAKYLADTLEQVNRDLIEASRPFGKPVQLRDDMELTYGGKPYRLLSESQQWRADLAMGLVLAAQCGGVVLMDRFDMVQPGDRGAILQMLATQTVAQVIFAATLKADPKLDPANGIYSYWIEG